VVRYEVDLVSGRLGKAYICGRCEDIDDVEREHDETQYLVKCADNVWRDQSARIVYATQIMEITNHNELPVGEFYSGEWIR